MDEQRVVVTFHTTTEAIAWEKVCKAENLPGRLIPMPPKISAGCGLAWVTTLQNRERLLAGVEEFCLRYDQVLVMDGVRV